MCFEELRQSVFLFCDRFLTGSSEFDIEIEREGIRT